MSFFWIVRLRWLPLVAVVLQLIGIVLLVWGLKVERSGLVSEAEGGQDGPRVIIKHRRPRVFSVGIWLLLLGLALQMIAAVLTLATTR